MDQPQYQAGLKLTNIKESIAYIEVKMLFLTVINPLSNEKKE